MQDKSFTSDLTKEELTKWKKYKRRIKTKEYVYLLKKFNV